MSRKNIKNNFRQPEPLAPAVLKLGESVLSFSERDGMNRSRRD